jgi:hypothetical protein
MHSLDTELFSFYMHFNIISVASQTTGSHTKEQALAPWHSELVWRNQHTNFRIRSEFTQNNEALIILTPSLFYKLPISPTVLSLQFNIYPQLINTITFNST